MSPVNICLCLYPNVMYHMSLDGEHVLYIDVEDGCLCSILAIHKYWCRICICMYLYICMDGWMGP